MNTFTNYRRLLNLTHHLYGLMKQTQTSSYLIREKGGLSYLDVRLNLLSARMQKVDSLIQPNWFEERDHLLKASAELQVVLKILSRELETLQESLLPDKESN